VTILATILWGGAALCARCHGRGREVRYLATTMAHTRPFRPAYLELVDSGELHHRAAAARELLRGCRLCPRRCGVNRLAGEQGACRLGDELRIASAVPHYGEEPPLVGYGGSGTIFLASCNLACLFCQNYELSHGGEGYRASPEDVARTMLALQQRGCHNVNFVTPTHVTPQLLQAIALAAEQGLSVPLVYNCGGYESVATLKLLDGVFDLYMPDFKYADAAVGARLSGVPDYPDVAKAALREMYRQVGDLVCDDDGLAQRGMIIRHLVLPNALAGTRDVARFVVKALSPNAYVNLMDQYRPCFRAQQHPEIARPLRPEEFSEAVRLAWEEGLTQYGRQDLK